MSSRVELFAQIRRDRRLDPLVSQRLLAKRYHVSRRTVRAALASAVPPTPGKRGPQVSALDPAKPWIDAMLVEDLTAPRKQRHTIRRVFERLCQEYGFTDRVSYSTVQNYVNLRRAQLAADRAAQHRVLPGMVAQLHEPGAEAEVDFCDAWIRLGEGPEPIRVHLFSLRLSYSGKAVHRVFASESQQAFMEGHVEAFRVLGGVPTRHIRYDNLKPAVHRICFGRTRIESQTWVAFRSHYGFDAFYCLPGKEGAHEKGGVENEGGRFRRAWLTPVPQVSSLAELNERLAAIDERENARTVNGKHHPVGVDFAAEAALLMPLPDDDFECGVTLSPTVNKLSRVTVRQCFYSVPARFIGRKLRVLLRANEMLVFDGRALVARHPRINRRYDYRDDLDHFLEILVGKPGALAGSTALAQARTDGVFTAVHEQFWEAAKAAHGPAQGTRILIEVLLLHRHRSPEAVIAGMQAALQVGSVNPELVAIEARKAVTAACPAAATSADPMADTTLAQLLPPMGIGPSGKADTDITDLAGITGTVADGLLDDGRPMAEVIELCTRLPADLRPPPSVDQYDQLLSHHRKPHHRQSRR